MLRATTACTFSTSQLPKVVRSSSVLSILTWKCASRHNGVHFFMSHLASWLRTRRFSEPTFRPSGAPNHWKNTVNRDFPTFSRICIFFLLTLLSSNLSLLSASSLLCFSSVHIVGSLASKLPSIIYIGLFIPSMVNLGMVGSYCFTNITSNKPWEERLAWSSTCGSKLQSPPSVPKVQGLVHFPIWCHQTWLEHPELNGGLVHIYSIKSSN